MTDAEFQKIEHTTDLNILFAHHCPALAGAVIRLLHAIQDSGQVPPDNVCKELITVIEYIEHIREEIKALNIPPEHFQEMLS